MGQNPIKDNLQVSSQLITSQDLILKPSTCVICGGDQVTHQLSINEQEDVLYNCPREIFYTLLSQLLKSKGSIKNLFLCSKKLRMIYLEVFGHFLSWNYVANFNCRYI